MRVLDCALRGFYIVVVFIRRIIAALLVTVWLAFFGVEFLWASGLVGPSRLDVVEPVEAALNSLTRAEIPDEKLAEAPDSLLVFFNPPVLESALFGHAPKTAKSVKGSFHIYKLHVALLL